MEMIRFEHVNKSFGAEKVLVDFSLHIEEGEFLTVIGRSGCGKTTMLRMINGLQIPDSGKVLVEGQDEMLSLQKKLHMTIVFITHDIREAMKLGDRVLVMEKGRIAQIGMPQEIREYPADDFVRELTQW